LCLLRFLLTYPFSLKLTRWFYALISEYFRSRSSQKLYSSNPVNICFDCNNNNSTTEVKKSYFFALVNDLEIRGITVPPVTSHAATLSAQASLLAIMKLETRISRLEAEIEFIEHNATFSAYLTENACPCSLHLEMRIMLKLLTTLIRDGLARAMLNERHELKAAKAFIQEVETVLKTKG
jgi:hypothetical protein